RASRSATGKPPGGQSAPRVVPGAFDVNDLRVRSAVECSRCRTATALPARTPVLRRENLLEDVRPDGKIRANASPPTSAPRLPLAAGSPQECVFARDER